ncbi:unnamed protein product [Rotaria sp. Silwood1]|nr:unnamed protein product [Rotaria sp. Silwood1]
MQKTLIFFGLLASLVLTEQAHGAELKSSPSECWKAWSRCTPGTSWGTGWLWQSCQDRCNCQQAETGKCESVPNTCPEVFEGSTIQQCHCYGTRSLLSWLEKARCNLWPS